ncbi:EF-hand calcium-binding domain-containing protein 11 isoform X1 [Castor canadensis]|uniref:EF-hand calcium-binding domain-containing protein 11 isoform X1 n=1 Tax=Castor canadensis TaxID=51338 RepID=A0AC58M216_CASCN
MFSSQAGARPRSWEASPSENKKWVEVFKTCDDGNKGYLSREDFKVAVVMLFGYKPSKIEADSVMSSINPNTSAIPLLVIYPKDCDTGYSRGTCTPIFIAALFTIAKLWKQPRCPTTDEWIKKMWNLYTMEFYAAMKKNEMLSFAGILLEEFLNIVRKKKEAQVYRNEIRHIFTAFDVHYRGFLTLEDFKKAFKRVAPKLPERTVLEAFRETDQDSDGHVSFRDFEYAMNHGQTK